MLRVSVFSFCFLDSFVGNEALCENLACGKPVRLSSTAGSGTPGRFAVAGKRSGLMKDGCASTKSELNPSMIVDLGDDYLISSVFIVNWKYRMLFN